MYFLYGRPHQMQDDIYVVDHQVQNHAYICSSWVEKCQPVRFYEHGFHGNILQGQKRRIESLYMSNLSLDPGFLYQVIDLPGFLRCAIGFSMKICRVFFRAFRAQSKMRQGRV